MFLDDYAVPLTVFGTVLLCLGMALCAYLIESTTKEQVYEKVVKSDPAGQSKMYWVQPGNQIIGDQVFDPFAYSDAKHTLRRYTTSWKDERKDSNTHWIWIAVATTATGFVSQFLGLRACHSSVAVIQLGVTVIMSLIRSGLRTQRLRKEENFMWVFPDFFQGHELDCLALKIGQLDVPRKVHSALLKENTAWEASYSLEIDLRRQWKIFSALKSRDANIATMSSADLSLNSNRSLSVKHSVLENLTGISQGQSLLSGFRIKIKHGDQKPNSLAELVGEAEEELLRWISTKYCNNQSCCTVEHCKFDLNVAVKTVLYRSRLARMTGLEEPESELSSYWGGKVVSVRDTALILARSIEDTMSIVFASDAQQPVTLHESWEHTFRMFWKVRCSLFDPLTQVCQDGDIHMALRREIDKDGAPEGSWRSDVSELEAVLSLWLWSLKKPHKGQDVQDTNSERVGQRISRILSRCRDPENAFNETLDLDIWRERGSVKIKKRRLRVLESGRNCQINDTGHNWDGTINCPQAQNALWWRDNEAFVTKSEGPPDDSNDQRRFFGWCNVGESSSDDYIDILDITSENSLLLNCAQEIYSTFLAAMMQAVENIGGSTKTRRHQDGFIVSNHNIDKIKSVLVTRGLCDAEDAFACTIPILKNQDKLAPIIDLSLAGELVAEYMQERNWKKAGELTGWMISRSHHRVCSTHEQKGSTTRLEVENSFRISLLEACENYRQATLQDDDEQKNVGCEGILELLRRYSRDETTMSIPFVWVDCGIVPDGLKSINQRLSLSDVIQSYGEVIMWCLNSKSSSALEQNLHDKLKEYIPEPRSIPTRNDLYHAIEHSDLSSTLYLLQRHSLSEPKKSIALSRASRMGWYMVAAALVRLGAQLKYEDDEKRNAFSYASELGDINTARILMKNGATLRNVDHNGGDYDQLSPLYYAAKQGHAVIIEEILEKYGNSDISNEQGDKGHHRMTPLSCAIRSGIPAAVHAIIKDAHKNYLNHYHTKEPALHLAISEKQGDLVDVLLANKAVDTNFNHSASVSSPPLVCAVRLRNESIFEKILNHARVDADCADKEDRTALWWAAALGLDSYVQKLLNSGKVYRPDKEDLSGITALSIAVELGHLNVARQLLGVVEAAAVSLKAILIAATNGHTSIVKEILPYRVKDKTSAERLLSNHGLEEVWRCIQNSEIWGNVTNEGESAVSNDFAEIGDLFAWELERASMISSDEFHIFPFDRRSF